VEESFAEGLAGAAVLLQIVAFVMSGAVVNDQEKGVMVLPATSCAPLTVAV
jgi:hypothetical protein